MDTSSLSFETHAGKLPWTEEGMALLAKIQSEIEYNGGPADMIKKIKEESYYVEHKPKRHYYTKIWTPEDNEYLYKNWNKVLLTDLASTLKCSVDSIRYHAYRALRLPYKNSLVA